MLWVIQYKCLRWDNMLSFPSPFSNQKKEEGRRKKEKEAKLNYTRKMKEWITLTKTSFPLLIHIKSVILFFFYLFPSSREIYSLRKEDFLLSSSLNSETNDRQEVKKKKRGFSKNSSIKVYEKKKNYRKGRQEESLSLPPTWYTFDTSEFFWWTEQELQKFEEKKSRIPLRNRERKKQEKEQEE